MKVKSRLLPYDGYIVTHCIYFVNVYLKNFSVKKGLNFSALFVRLIYLGIIGEVLFFDGDIAESNAAVKLGDRLCGALKIILGCLCNF